MSDFLLHVLKLFGVVYLRFRLIPRLWCVWLVAVNAACLLFITHIEAQAVLAVTVIAVVVQALVYQRIGFTRILGSAHIMWVPMFAWFATRHEMIAREPAMANWLLLLLATNMVSMIVDTTNAVRFIRGERAPHYHWKKPEPV